MMRHLTWSRARVDDALLRREAVAARHECAQRLNDPTLAAPKKAPTGTARQNMGRFCTNGHARRPSTSEAPSSRRRDTLFFAHPDVKWPVRSRASRSTAAPRSTKANTRKQKAAFQR